MIAPRLVLCNGASARPKKNECTLPLNIHGDEANVNLGIADVARVLLRDIPPRVKDLLELASYVHAADCAIPRGSGWLNHETEEPWQRRMRFVVGVRDPDFWSDERTRQSLAKTLGFLSSDEYEFQFKPIQRTSPEQMIIEAGENESSPFHTPDRVTMFSGGLDSLAGALASASQDQDLLLVTHISVGVTDKRVRDLTTALAQHVGRRRVFPVRCWINKHHMDREHTQRTRSFLFAALGTAVADAVGAAGVRFYENGVVSLNLPIADEVVRARASRTTHPWGLKQIAALMSLVLERPFVVDNPFVFMTKSEVVNVIAQQSAEKLIGLTCSCGHQGFFKSKTGVHCGTCSQCIDRRVAVFANGVQEHDPEEDYAINVFTGSRAEGLDRNVAVHYARHAYELSKMSEAQIATSFQRELGKAAVALGNHPEIMCQLAQLHRRHAETVMGVLVGRLAENTEGVLNGTLPGDCMLGLLANRKHLEPAWKMWCRDVEHLLAAGIPRACAGNRPANEPQLQKLCDGILNAHTSRLQREHPFVTWSCVAAKPDFSDDRTHFWIELKYVRKKSDLMPITEAIAADITKYGDNGSHVLYVVYDPEHLVTNEAKFSDPILRRSTMNVCFIR